MITCGLVSSSRASTPPLEERVTSFFTRVKKEVTKKESTLRGAPGLTHGDREKLRGSQLRVRRRNLTAYRHVSEPQCAGAVAAGVGRILDAPLMQF